MILIRVTFCREPALTIRSVPAFILSWTSHFRPDGGRRHLPELPQSGNEKENVGFSCRAQTLLLLNIRVQLNCFSSRDSARPPAARLQISSRRTYERSDITAHRCPPHGWGFGLGQQPV